MNRRWLGLVALVIGASCAWGPKGGQRQPGKPETFALLLNGGGTPMVNYLSHVQHLAGMDEVLRSRGLPRDHISVLASDGAAIAPDVAVGAPAKDEMSWLLDGTFLERPLGHPIRYLTSDFVGYGVRAARRPDLDTWFGEAARNLRSGDTLFTFVTDHGQPGKTPADGLITLWDRQTISVKEVGALLGRLDRGVRVVTVMAQCFSGSFAELALDPSLSGRPIGSTCGYFSTTFNRTAYGCYAESGTAPDDGYAYRMIVGLRRSRSLAAAHAEALVTDRTPDVPLRSSDIYLGRLVERVAQSRNVSSYELVSSLAAEALAQNLEEARLVGDIAATFAIPVPRESGELAALTQRLEDLRTRLTDGADVWTAALGELTEANLEAFLAATPRWQSVVVPRELAQVPVSGLPALQTRFLTNLAGFTVQQPATLERLKHGHLREQAARATAFRSEVRVAALLRLRTLLFTLVGRRLLDQLGTPAERAEFAALRACETFALPTDGIVGTVTSSPRPFPSIENDEHLAVSAAPGSLGASVYEVPAAERAARALPEGAVVLRAVEPDGPAGAAGLRDGDVLLGGPGTTVRERGAMKLHLASSKPDRQLEIIRGGERRTVSVTLRMGTRAAEARDLRAAGRAALASLRLLRGADGTMLGNNKPFLLFFWATWCDVCKKAIPELLALERQRGVQIVAVTNERQLAVEHFLHNWKDPFPELIALDLESRATESFRVDGYPTFVLVDENGRVRLQQSGYRAANGLPMEGWSFSGKAAGSQPPSNLDALPRATPE